MEPNELKRVLENIDRRTYETAQTAEAMYKKVDYIESRVREIHDLVRYIRANCAEEKQIDRLRDDIRGVEREISKLR